MHSTQISAPRGLTLVCLLIILCWGIIEARPFLNPLCIASLLALMMAPLVRIMRRHHFPEWSAIALSAILLIFPFLSMAYVLFWQGQSLIKDFPKIMTSLNHVISQFVNTPFGQKLRLAHTINMPALIDRLEGSVIQGAQLVIAGLGAILEAGSQILLIILFGLLMLASREHLRTSFEKILTQSMAVSNSQLLDDVVTLIEKFLLARLLIMIIVAGIDIGILEIGGVRYAILWGSFLGILTAVPAIGFIIGVIPPLIVSLASGFTLLKISGILIGLVIVSIIEGNLLTPKMVGKRLNINALAVFVGLFAGGLIWGIWGMFLSIPVLGILRIVFTAAPALRPWGEILADKSNGLEALEPSTKEKVA